MCRWYVALIATHRCFFSRAMTAVTAVLLQSCCDSCDSCAPAVLRVCGCYGTVKRLLQDSYTAEKNRELLRTRSRITIKSTQGTLAIPFPANSRIELRVTAENISILNQDVLLL